MKKIVPLLLIIFSVYIAGCSMPIASSQKYLYRFTKEEKRIKEGFTKKRRIEIKDFRGNEVYEEDTVALAEKIEQYFSNYPQRPDAVKNSLREFKVSEGLNKRDVELLLGRADKIMQVSPKKNTYSASSLWIYKKNKMRAFMLFIIPIFFVHESYYLYFKDDTLTGIESHALGRVVEESPGKGLFEKEVGALK